MSYYMNFEHAIEEARQKLRTKGKLVDVGRWQGIDISGKEEMITHELFDWSFSCKISPSIDTLVKQIKPNLPWADEHFEERVGGVPTNPGEAYKNWPYFRRQKENDRHRDIEGKHAHTYQERMWVDACHQGVRYDFGNLGDVVDLLEREPLTRQAYLPIWFPEDTGVVFRGRVPCTLGYHFMLRNNELHIFYDIRSCDFIRHFRDDIYMAARLLIWVLDELKAREDKEGRESIWADVRPGRLRMNIHSLHIFAAEKHVLEKKS